MKMSLGTQKDKCHWVKLGQVCSRFLKRQAHRSMRRLGKQLGEDAPKVARYRGYAS